MPIPHLKEVKYETLATWRNGWRLIKLPDGRHYLKRAFRGQYPVLVEKTGFCQWRITEQKSGEVIHPERLK